MERSEDDPPEEECSDKLLGDTLKEESSTEFPDDKSELNGDPESPAEDLAEECSGEAPNPASKLSREFLDNDPDPDPADFYRKLRGMLG